MKSFLTILFCIALCNLCFSQSDTIYLNADSKACKKSQAKFYRLISKVNEKRVARDYGLNGTLLVESEISKADPITKNGDCIYFNEEGKKESAGSFKNDKRLGVWTFWFDNGNDSIINEYDENGSIKRIRPPDPVHKNLDIPFNVVEHMPEFPGGESELLKYIEQHLSYPTSAVHDRIQGQVVINFVVDHSGNISGAKVFQGIRKDVDDAALKVVNEMPRWSPGTQNGKTVNVSYRLPIHFALPKKKH